MNGECLTATIGVLDAVEGLQAGVGSGTAATLLAELGYGRFVGRMHPIVVHFPIALLIVAAIVEAFRIPFSKSRRPSGFGLTAVLFAAAFAAWAATSGWLNADFESHEESSTLGWHRWMGVIVAGLAFAVGIAALVASFAKGSVNAITDDADEVEGEGDFDEGHVASTPEARPPSGRAFSIYRYGVILAAVLVGFTGHLGGELVYGEGYLMKAWPRAEATSEPVQEPESSSATARTGPTAEGGSSATPASGSSTSTDEVVSDDESNRSPAAGTVEASAASNSESSGGEAFARDEQAAAAADPKVFFATAVLPALQARCVECHGPDKAKAALRLDSLEATLAGDELDRVVVPGDPGESLLLQRIELPRDHVDAMPPKGEGMTEAEIAAIRDWITALPAE